MEAAFEVFKYVTHTLSCTCRFLEFLLVIFLVAQYFKPNSKFISAYFIILLIGYFTDLLMFAHWIWSIVFPVEQILYLYTVIFHEWHNTYFLSIWNAVLCCNRCTALAFPIKHEKIWTTKTMLFIGPLTILFPFIISGYELFIIPCVYEDIMTCVVFRIAYYFKAAIVNVIVNIFGILFIVYSMYKSSQTKKTFTSLHEKVERRLIYQAIISSIIQLIFFLSNLISTMITTDIKVLYFVGYISNIIYYIHHYAIMITHFIFSPSFKKGFFDFYKLSFLLGNKQNNNTKVVVITPFHTQTSSRAITTTHC